MRELVEHERSADRLIADGGRARWIGSAQVSPSLVEIVEQQIGGVPDDVREVIDLVAVAEPVDWNCLAALADPSAVERAEQHGLIRTDGDVVFVGHPMYAEVRLDQCGPTRLRRLRGQLAAVMKTGSGKAYSVRRGLLWLESDLPPDPAVLSAAATAASSLLDFELAERLSRAAAAAGVGAPAQVHLAYNLFMQRKGTAAADVLNDIAADAVEQSAFINEVILRAANLLWTLRSPDESWQVIDEALAHATGPRRAQLLTFRANQLALAARPREVLETLTDLDYSALDAFGATIGLCSETLAYGEIGQPDIAIARAAACHRIVDDSEQASFLGQPLAEFHTFALSVAGRIAEGTDVAARHRHHHDGAPATARVLADSIAGTAALAAGDLTAALHLLPAADAYTDTDFVLANSFHRFQLLRAQALARTGQIDAAEAALQSAHAHRHPSYVYVQSSADIAAAWLAAARLRLGEARQHAWRAAQFAADHGQWAREVLYLQTAVQFDDTSAGPRLAELARLVRGPRAPLAARYADAVARDDAEELEQISAEWESMGDRLAAADAAGQAAASYRRAGRAGSAMTAASRTAQLAHACGGAVSPAIAAARFTPPFTQREREIALLVAQGLTNREIAENVSLSVRTIEGHIYRASCKAGVAKRADLARLVKTIAGA